MSLARALSFNGLANAFHIAAINGGRHAAPLFAGGTVYAWSEILETAESAGPPRCRGAADASHRATRDLACGDFPRDQADGDGPGVILELDYWVLMPRRGPHRQSPALLCCTAAAKRTATGACALRGALGALSIMSATA